MPCCGKGRVVRSIRRSEPAVTRAAASARVASIQKIHDRPASVLFQYTGHSGMTVFGPFTGQRYRFTAPGAVVSIDPRDAPSVAGVPRLKRITK